MFLEDLAFYKSASTECGYLPNRQETKILTWLHPPQAEEIYQNLLELGFRRSQTIMYKPFCHACKACIPMRLPVHLFQINKQQKRVIQKTHDIYRRIVSPVLQEYHYALYQKYMQARHAGESMSLMSAHDVAMMVEETTIDTVIIEYYYDTPHETMLTGWTITDLSAEGISMVYSVFDPDESHRSLGNFAILDHLALAKQLCIPYVYLGYWIEKSQKMSYKNQFKPHEMFLPDQGWVLQD